jgi:hypothetical protein
MLMGIRVGLYNIVQYNKIPQDSTHLHNNQKIVIMNIPKMISMGTHGQTN